MSNPRILYQGHQRTAQASRAPILPGRLAVGVHQVWPEAFTPMIQAIGAFGWLDNQVPQSLLVAWLVADDAL